MKEDFLHYVWQYKKFNFTDLETVDKQIVTIVHSGYFIQQAGPDFFNAQLIIDNQKWAGNVEIHLKSSDWYVHHHETDPNYDNVVLHVVWEHDTDVFRKNNTQIPVLELKKYVSSETLNHYQNLFKTKSWINCENELSSIDDFTKDNWIERLFFERLEKKAILAEQLLQQNTFDWEATFLQLLAKSFGLNTNGSSFLRMMQSIPFSIIKKERSEIIQLESLFFGVCGLLNDEKEDEYFSELKKRWDFSRHKFQLIDFYCESVHFFKLRPDNFPTIRLAQLAQVICKNHQLFEDCIKAKSVNQIYQFFQVNVSEYWQSHYVFDKINKKKNKFLTKDFIDLIIINCILPIKFAFSHAQGNVNSEELTELISEIAPEKNKIIENFAKFGLKSTNSYHTQALIQLKNDYCNAKRCLNCAFGQKLINFTS